MKVAHIITGLHVGGAERFLSALVPLLEAQGVRNEVISLTGDGPCGDELRSKGVRVKVVDARGPGRARAMRRVGQLLRTSEPDVVQSWLYNADLVASLVVPRHVPLAWNVRQSWPGERRPWDEKAVARILTFFARGRRPAVIIANSRAALETHVAHGYPESRMCLIPNGVDTDRFAPDAAARSRVRADLGIGDQEILVGSFGRYDPGKGHLELCRALELAGTFPLRLMLCGAGTEPGAAPMDALLAGHRIPDPLRLGRRDDVPALMAACDLVVSASLAEGFPNVLLEALAVGCSCVATDAGDSAAILGGLGWVVPAADPEALAAAISDAARTTTAARAALGREGRARAVAHFSMATAVARYESLYRELLQAS